MTKMEPDRLRQLSNECEMELERHILPFWLSTRDERGGFFGKTSRNLDIQKDADKDVILHAKILWSFSEAYILFGKAVYLDAAEHAYRFLRKAEDAANGGMFRSLSADMLPCDTSKPTDGNAFTIYALCAYAKACRSQEAIDFAMRIFRKIEGFAATEYGYMEMFRREKAVKPSSESHSLRFHAARSVNTPLHLLEAYAELYQLTQDSDVQAALHSLLMLFQEKIYNPKAKKLEVFFDEKMNPLGELHSYGHDIEASWLIDHACVCLGDQDMTTRFRKLNYQLANHVNKVAYQDGAILQERFGTEINKTRVWWVEAEGVVGFLNAAETAQLFRETDKFHRFTTDAVSLWSYIRDNHIDSRTGGEWFAETNLLGEPQSDYDMANARKSPYHNSRMCLEVIKRTARICSTHA